MINYILDDFDFDNNYDLFKECIFKILNNEEILIEQDKLRIILKSYTLLIDDSNIEYGFLSSNNIVNYIYYFILYIRKYNKIENINKINTIFIDLEKPEFYSDKFEVLEDSFDSIIDEYKKFT